MKRTIPKHSAEHADDTAAPIAWASLILAVPVSLVLTALLVLWTGLSPLWAAAVYLCLVNAVMAGVVVAFCLRRTGVGDDPDPPDQRSVTSASIGAVFAGRP